MTINSATILCAKMHSNIVLNHTECMCVKECECKRNVCVYVCEREKDSQSYRKVE